jgi:hypothetical protein
MEMLAEKHAANQHEIAAPPVRAEVDRLSDMMLYPSRIGALVRKL